MRRSLLYPSGPASDFILEDWLADVRLAEELGLEAVWCFPESTEEGSFRGSAPEIWLSALASRTERIRLGWGLAGLLPLTQAPLRIAERTAALDLASRGRLELALLPEPGATDEVGWDEGVRMLVEMWSAAEFQVRSAEDVVTTVAVVPKPVQTPHPPIWFAGWSATHATQAGRAGMAYLDLSGATSAPILELHRDCYLEARAGADPARLLSVAAFAVAGELERGRAGAEQLERWEALGIDQAILRVGDAGESHEDVRARIRHLAGGDASTHGHVH